MKNHNYTYSHCSLFKGLHPSQIKDLLSGIFFKHKTFYKDDILIFQDEKADYLIIILEGSVRGEMNDFSGKSIIIEEIESGKPLAPAFLFGKNNKFPVNIVAQTEVLTMIIPKDSLIKLLKNNEIVLNNFLNIISNKAQFLANKIKFLSFHNIKGKFAFYILELSKNNNSNDIFLPLSHSQLAELFGVTRPSLSRAIRELHNSEIIKAKGKNIQILNTYELYELIK